MSAQPRTDDAEIWFCTGSQHLYGEETLRQVAEQSQAIARALGDAAAVPMWCPVIDVVDQKVRTEG